MKMVFIDQVPRSLEKPQCSMVHDENMLYLQPGRARLTVYNRPYRKPTLKVDSDTTYGLSYKKLDRTFKPVVNYGKHEKIIADKTGEFYFDTVYKLSYPACAGKVRKAFVPKPCLSINGSHDMTSVQKISYTNPGYVKTISCKPYKATLRHPLSMDCRTTTKESYQDFGTPVEVKRPRKRDFWQTKFKPDYRTTSQLSYQYVKPISRRIRERYRPVISVRIEKDTIYNTSYQVPGRFTAKNNVVPERHV